MALSKPLTEELKGDLHCSICIERYEKPRMLPCVHSFCLKCLEKCESNLKPGKAFTCPTCRGVVKLPEQGVKGLPSNFFIVNLMEKLDLAEEFSGKATSKCSFCNESNGQIYCLDCKLLLCTSCRSVHSRISGTQEHIIANVGRLSDPQYVKQLTSGQAPRCKTHPSEKLRFFCSNCKSLVCRDCMLLSHQGHQCVEAKSRAQSARAALQHSLSKVDTMEKQGKQEELANSKKDLHSQSAHARSEIENHFSSAVARLQSDKQKLLADVTRIEERQQRVLEEEEAEVSCWIEAAQNTKRMTERVIEENNEWQIISMERDLIGAINNLGQQSKSSNSPQGSFRHHPESISSVVVEEGVIHPIHPNYAIHQHYYRMGPVSNPPVSTTALPIRAVRQDRPNFEKSDFGVLYTKTNSQAYSQSRGYNHPPTLQSPDTYCKVGNLLGKVIGTAGVPQPRKAAAEPDVGLSFNRPVNHGLPFPLRPALTDQLYPYMPK